MGTKTSIPILHDIPYTPRLLSVALCCAWAAGSSLAQAATGPIDPVDPANPVPKYVIPLVIPPEMPKSGTTEPCPSGAYCPQTKYNIAVRQFQQQILPGGVWNTVNGRADGFGATTVWSYGPAGDPLPSGGVAPVPAAQSSFNYPAFTVENKVQNVNTVRWINELVTTDPTTGKPYPLSDARRTALHHLLPIDRTLHWANPEKLACGDPATGAPLSGATNCRPYVDPINPNPLLSQSYDGPVPMVVHVHGAEVNPYSDGFPEAWWLPAGKDAKGNAVALDYANHGNHYDQSPMLRKNSYPGSAAFSYENTQPATTLWYHDHTLGMTANNVYAGPAGFWLLRGDYKAPDGTMVKEQPVKGKLPGSDGVFQRPTNPKITYDARPGCDPNFDAVCRARIREIPIAIQDRSFNSDGSLFYPDSRSYFDGGPLFTVPYLPNANSDVSPIHQPEFFGNMIVVNGTVWPTLDVVPQRYRFRLLAGADSRTFNLSMWAIPPGATPPSQNSPTYVADLKAIPGVKEIPFYQIGAEQGFLPKVVRVSTGYSTALPGNGTEPVPVCPPAGASTTATTPPPKNLLEMMEHGKDRKKDLPPPTTGCLTGTLASSPDRALLMAPAERADVIVDFTGLLPGTKVRMVNTGPDVPFNDGWIPADIANPAAAGQVMEFNVKAPTASTPPDDSTPPAFLVMSSEPANTATPANTRQAALIEDDSKKLCVTVDPIAGITVVQSFATPQPDLATTCASLIDPVTKLPLGAIPFGPTETFVGTLVNGIPQAQPWAAPVHEAPTVGTTEVWEIYNFTVDAHPMHLHGARVQVVNREALVLDPTTGVPVTPVVTTGVMDPAEPTEAGYKDIVIVDPGTVTRIKAKFEIPGLYVWHCHIVEHEDNEMMVPICIKGAATDTSCTATPGVASSGAAPWPIQ